jgi:hypothetical protein
MLVARIIAKPDTDIELEISRLRQLGNSYRIPQSTLDDILVDVKSTLEEFLVRGRNITSAGSQIALNHSITGDDFQIAVSYDNNAKGGLLARLLNYVRER